MTLTTPLPLLEFCNKPLMEHQLSALKAAGVTEVVFCIQSRSKPEQMIKAISACEATLGIKTTVCHEPVGRGTAGSLKQAQEIICAGSSAPFFVVNSDVLCSYPLRDLLHVHMKHGKEATMLTTRTDDPSKYGVVVVDERTGVVRHFVNKPQTFVSDVINAGVYVFSCSIFDRISPGRDMSMNEIFPLLAAAEELGSMLLTGYWIKITHTNSFLAATGPQLEMMRFMSPGCLTTPAQASAAGFTVRGDVMIHPGASIGAGCVLGPKVVIGPNCVLAEGVRLENAVLLEGAEVRAHSLVKESIVGWRSVVGKWCFVDGSVFGEEVSASEGLLVRGATVLPHKELRDNIRTTQIVI